MYRLPLADHAVDMVVLQMVLHYAEQPESVIAEAARVLRPGGTLLVVDLLAHGRTDVTGRLAHRWPGFSDDALHRLMAGAGLEPGDSISVPAALPVGIWPAIRGSAATTAAARPEAVALFA
jgi:ArsR family transcriptional regulator